MLTGTVLFWFPVVSSAGCHISPSTCAAVVLIGNLAPLVVLPLQAVVTRELSLYGSCMSCGEYPAALAMIARGEIRVDPLISAIAPLSEGHQWFERLTRPESGLMKVVLVP